MNEQKYDAMFSLGILDGDIRVEVTAVDKKLVSICHIIDDENEKLPDKLLFDERGIPLPKKPILYSWIHKENLETFNWNRLIEMYDKVYLRIQKPFKFKHITSKFTKKTLKHIAYLDILGLEIEISP
jgi:hypothetical protein